MAKEWLRSPGLQALHDRYIGDDSERAASYEQALAEAKLSINLYELRTAAGLSQRELAARVGTTASVISRLENADHAGYSMSLMRRIAAAVGKRIELVFVPLAPVPEGSKVVDKTP